MSLRDCWALAEEWALLRVLVKGLEWNVSLIPTWKLPKIKPSSENRRPPSLDENGVWACHRHVVIFRSFQAEEAGYGLDACRPNSMWSLCPIKNLLQSYDWKTGWGREQRLDQLQCIRARSLTHLTILGSRNWFHVIQLAARPPHPPNAPSSSSSLPNAYMCIKDTSPTWELDRQKCCFFEKEIAYKMSAHKHLVSTL